MTASDPMNKPIWKSSVWHKDQCYYVSTIEQETIVWEFDWDKQERGRIVKQGGGIDDHQTICREIIDNGITTNNI